jgi:hypothetical protein
MAQFHSGGFDHLCGVREARRASSSLQSVMEAQFLFAVVALVLVIFDHVLAVDQPVAITIVHAVVLLLVLIILGSWFFRERGTKRNGTLLGGSGSLRLIALTFAIMIIVAFAVVLPVQVFLSKHLSPPP